MRWISGTRRANAGLLRTLPWFLLALPLAAAPEKRLSIYSTAANYSLPVVQREAAITSACWKCSIL